MSAPPADWKKVRLGDLLGYEQPTKYLVSSSDYVEGGQVPVLTAGKSFLLGYTDDTDGIYTNLPTIIFDDFTTATQWVDFEFKVKSSACKMLSPKNGACNPRYVFERLRALNYQTSDHKRHWISVFHSMEMLMPPLKEQGAIAEALSDADSAIESLDALISKKRDVKQATMQQLLTGRTRLPGFTTDWKEVRLGDLGPLSKGVGIRKNEVTPYGIPCVRYGQIYTDYNFVIGEIQTFVSPQVASNSRRLRRGEILFAGSGETKEDIGKCIAYVKDVGAVAGGDIIVLTPEGADSRFLGYSLNSPNVALQKMSRAQGDAVVHISAANLASIVLDLPPLREQEAIAEALSVIDDELEALTEQVSKLRMVKDGMMQDLLTGKRRLV